MSVTRCKVCSNPTVRAQVARMVEEGLSDEAISRALNSVGVVIGKSSILRHRQNHSDEDVDLDDVEFPEGMEVPRPTRVELGSAMGDDPAKLLESVREKVHKQRGDIVEDRMVRETLLQQILESQLAITATALDRYQQGEGRYPIDMVKATASTWALFEKTSLHSMVANASESFLFDNEVERLERFVFQDAKTRVLNGEKVPTEPPEEHLMGEKIDFMGQPKIETFVFCGYTMDGDTFNWRMSQAWNEGRKAGKNELAKVAA
jgi:hypothetical protein